MKEIELNEITESAHKDYAPVELSNGITISASRDVKDDTYLVEGTIKKGQKDIGRFVMDEEHGRLFVNVNSDDLPRNSKREIVETISAIILQLVPEETAEESAQ